MQHSRAQADHLHGEMDGVGKQIGHLLTAIERGGWTEEVQEHLNARKREKLQIEANLAGIEQKLKMGKLKVSDEVLRYMADHFAEALTSRHPDYARRLIQMVVPKAELYKEKLRLYYTPEILMETLTLSVAQGITGLWTVPPWEFESQFWP